MNSNEDAQRTAPKEKTPTGWHKFWSSEMEACEKRLRTFRRQGNVVTARFLGSGSSVTGDAYDITAASSDNFTQLNLFHTNITTLQSMLYGATPKVEVSREHHDPDDDVARVAATLFSRILQSDVEVSGQDLATNLRMALQDRLVPGLGVCRLRYTFKKTKETVIDPVTVEPVQMEKITDEEAPIDYIHWQDFRWGWSRSWDELPWMAFRSWLSKDECVKRFGKKVANQLEYKQQAPTGSDKTEDITDSDMENNVQKAEIWEIWDKNSKKAFWWSEGVDVILDAEEDPLELDGFWPVPRPMMANLTTSMMIPKADYILHQDLYNQIDELSSRVTVITRAVKVVGVYDASSSNSVGRMLKEGVENELIPVDNWAMLAEKGGLKGIIDWFPVGDVVATLQTLREILSSTIEMLYQVTGMSDILRGANTDQYTSDGTNQLKAKFGSIRVQALQDEFARFASDLEALKAEVISKHFEKESIAKQSNAQYMPTADHDKIGSALELMQSEDIRWRVNIRPESIAMVDFAQLKNERTEYLTAMGTYMQSAVSAAKEVPGSLPLLLEFMKYGMAGFKGSDYMEGMLDQAIEAAKKMPEKPDQSLQQEQAKQQGEMAKIQAKQQGDLQLVQAKTQSEMQLEQQEFNNKMQLENTEFKNQMAALMANTQSDLRTIAEKLGADLQRERAQSTYAAAEEELQHGNRMAEIEEQEESSEK